MYTENDAWEDRWQQESDARALARAEEVKKDKIRQANAQAMAGVMVAKEMQEFESLARVAGMRVTLENGVNYKYNNPATVKNL